MRFRILITVGLVVCSHAAFAETFEGPLGLKWGMPKDEVRKQIESNPIIFVIENVADGGITVEQEYAGKFAGIGTKQMAASFYQEKLFGFTVVFEHRTLPTATQRWLELVEKLSEKYGKPQNVSKIPETIASLFQARYPNTKNKTAIGALLALDGDQRHFEMLDQKIASGDWKPKAEWRFSNSARIIYTVQLIENLLYSTLMYVDGSVVDLWNKKANEAAKADL